MHSQSRNRFCLAVGVVLTAAMTTRTENPKEQFSTSAQPDVSYAIVYVHDTLIAKKVGASPAPVTPNMRRSCSACLRTSSHSLRTYLRNLQICRPGLKIDGRRFQTTLARIFEPKPAYECVNLRVRRAWEGVLCLIVSLVCKLHLTACKLYWFGSKIEA